MNGVVKTKNFADNLITARLKKDFSQAELAELVGVQQSAISHFELGDRMPGVATASAIADKLDLTLDELFHGDFSAKTDVQTATAETTDEQTAERTDENE